MGTADFRNSLAGLLTFVSNAAQSVCVIYLEAHGLGLCVVQCSGRSELGRRMNGRGGDSVRSWFDKLTTNGNGVSGTSNLDCFFTGFPRFARNNGDAGGDQTECQITSCGNLEQNLRMTLGDL